LTCALTTSTTKGQIYRTQKPDFSKRVFTQKFREKSYDNGTTVNFDKKTKFFYHAIIWSQAEHGKKKRRLILQMHHRNLNT